MKESIAKIKKAILCEYAQYLKDIVIGDYLMLRWKENVSASMRNKCQNGLISKCENNQLCAIYEESESNEFIWSYKIELEQSVSQGGAS